MQRILSVKSSVDISSLEKDYWRRGDPADQILLPGNFGNLIFRSFYILWAAFSVRESLHLRWTPTGAFQVEQQHLIPQLL